MNLSLAQDEIALSTKITVSSGLSKIFAAVVSTTITSSGLILNCCLNPVRVVGYFCIDAVLALTSAALPEAGDPVHHPDAVLLTEQWSSTVPCTRVYPTASVTRAKHILCDVVVLVHTHTVAHRYNRHLTKIKIKTCHFYVPVWLPELHVKPQCQRSDSFFPCPTL